MELTAAARLRRSQGSAPGSVCFLTWPVKAQEHEASFRRLLRLLLTTAPKGSSVFIVASALRLMHERRAGSLLARSELAYQAPAFRIGLCPGSPSAGRVLGRTSEGLSPAARLLPVPQRQRQKPQNK